MICPFCEKNVEKLKTNSHVIPKWMYKPTYEGNKGFYSISLQKEKMEKAQDGFKSTFICDACEHLFEKDDTFASWFFVGRKGQKKIKNIANAELRTFWTTDGPLTCLVLNGVDFKRVQKFVFGVFLRSYLAKIDTKNRILGEKHFKKVRKMYMTEEDMDDKVYPIFIYKVNPNDWLRNIVGLPTRSEKGKYGLNSLIFSGSNFQFQMIVQSHHIPNEALSLRLTNTGNLTIPILKPSTKQMVEKFMKMPKDFAQKKKWVRPTS
jgi:hypothetical protein